jgi:hypothetical protein
LRAIHSADPTEKEFGINGFTGDIENMREKGI